MPSNVVNLLGGLPGGQMRVTVPPSEVVARLQAELDPDPPVGGAWGYALYRGKYRFYGSVDSSSFRIRKWVNRRRPDDPALVGTIRPDGAGSLITFEVRPAKWSLIVLAACPVLWGVMWLFVLPDIVPFVADWGVWGRLGIAAFVIPLLVFFWWLLRNEGKALLAFLEDRLGDAQVREST
jgi:hypothetical protein